MFEKEAEEYVIKKHNIDITKQPVDFALRCEFAEDFTDFQKGAEFGYKLAHEEMDYLNKHWGSEEERKTNEWHKADEKPKVTKEYLVYLISGYNCRSVNMMIYNAERGFWCADNQNDVVYWKEIVLPKESE